MNQRKADKILFIQSEKLIDIKLYDELSFFYRKIVFPDTFNFFFFFHDSFNFCGILDSNFTYIDRNVEVFPFFSEMLLNYLLVSFTVNEDTLRRYLSKSNYMRICGSGDVHYHFFSMNVLPVSCSDVISHTEPFLVYIPKKTFVIVSCPFDVFDLLYEPYKTYFHANFFIVQ